MLLEPSSDQEFFRDTTARFLKEQVPPSALRDLRNEAMGYVGDYWRRGAELGWTSLLVDETHGGGSISGDSVSDLALLAYEFGRNAAPGPLMSTNVAAKALGSADGHTDLLAGLLDGSSVITWGWEEGPRRAYRTIATTIIADGSDVVVNGLKRPVEAAASASHVLVTGRTGEGLSQVLVPVDAPGVSIEPMGTVDLTRRFAAVRCDDVRLPAAALVGDLGRAGDDVERQLQIALVILNAEAVGAMQTAFEMTVEWAFDRYSFGRPLASYQALKHRFADMKAWLEASHGLSDQGAAAVGAGAEHAGELTSATKAFVGSYGSELMQECVQMHGGIGVTFEHDLHLYLRRHTVDRALLGSPADHRRWIGEQNIAKQTAEGNVA
jgi:alkylation response protein AidB-like acyl-CoA dehydrogenase